MQELGSSSIIQRVLARLHQLNQLASLARRIQRVRQRRKPAASWSTRRLATHA